MTPLKEAKLEPETDNANSLENDVIKADKNRRNSKAPPENTGHETVVDLFRWPLLLKFTVICSLVW